MILPLALLTLSLAFTTTQAPVASTPSQSAPATQLPVAPGPTAMLTHEQLEKIIPATVFFAGQTATVQLRNAAGIRLGDGAIAFAVKVDTGGYASSIQERYQDYFITEAPIGLGDRSLPAGAYGIGFVGASFIVMNIGGQQVFSIPAQTDPTLKRPMPLQILQDATSGTCRLYSGRTYITLNTRTTR